MRIVRDAVRLVALDAHRREALRDLEVGLRDANVERLGGDLDVRAANLIHDETRMLESMHGLQLLVDRVDPVPE